MRKILQSFLICLFLIFSTLYGQNTSQDTLSSSIGLQYRPALMLPDFNHSIEFQYNEDLPGDINEALWLPPSTINNPFQMDIRTSSYYVPRMVRDELNLIMNRPRESAFVPVLGVAFIAFQLAQKYLFIRSKTTITSFDLLSAKDDLDILETLWEKSPQNIGEIYNKLPGLNPTLPHLENRLELLQDHKLIRTRKTELHTLYFPAISKESFRSKIIEALSDSTLTEKQKKTLQNFLPDL
jgi:predicted transcriptional regulator